MKKSIMILLVLALLVLAPFGTVSAAPQTNILSSETADTETENSLTVHFYVQIKGIDTPLPGAEIGIYKAAELKFDTRGNAYYQLMPEFQSLTVMKDGRDVTFEGISGTDADALVKKIEAFSAPSEMTAVTDRGGDARFSGLSSGIYIVKELRSSGLSDEYELFAPYFIAVPFGRLGEKGYEWQHEVISEPKTLIKPKEKPPESSNSIPVSDSSVPSVPHPSYPDSGETPNSALRITVMMLGALLLMLVLTGRKGKEEN